MDTTKSATGSAAMLGIVCVVICALLAVILPGAPAHAAQNATNATVKSKQTFYTYVKAGETYSSSFVKRETVFAGIGDPVITVITPSGASTECTNIKQVPPNNSSCLFTEVAPVDGVYATTISSSDPTSTVFQTRVTMRWTIQALNGATPIEGRTWSDKFHMRDELRVPQTLGVPILSLWYQTEYGYQYKVDRRQLNGIDSVYLANAFGMVNTETCQPIYRSIGVLPADPPPVAFVEDSGCSYQPYKVFFEQPAADLPATVTLPDTGQTTWMIRPILDPQVASLSFQHSSPGSRNGQIVFDMQNYEGPVKLQVDTNNNGVFTDDVDREIPAVATTSGATTVDFDGLDGLGATIPVNTPLAVRLSIDRVGEVHFIDGDLEFLTGGIEITRLNGPAENRTRIFWNDELINDPQYNTQALLSCSATPALTSAAGGTDSTGGVHAWGVGTCANATLANPGPGDTTNGGTWGNNRMIDNWTYIDANVAATTDVPGYQILKQTDHAAGATLNPGEKVDYTIKVTPVPYSAPQEITAGLAASTWSAVVFDDLSNVTDDASAPLTDLQATGNLGTFSPGSTGWTWTGADLPLGSPVDLTYSTSVMEAPLGDLKLANTAYAAGEEQPNCVPGLCSVTENPVAQIKVEKFSDPVSGSTVKPGDKVKYTLVVTNITGVELDDVTVEDNLESVLQSTTLSGSPSSSAGEAPEMSGNTLTWNGSLAAGAAASITYSVVVNQDAASGATINNVVVARSEVPGDPSYETPPSSTTHNVSNVIPPKKGLSVTGASGNDLFAPALAVLALASGAALLALKRRRTRA
ncbi:isopeptide-forming domain-containing fimbrial protein [Leucobacter viscericola]|uniref:Isopeptide-forming domain-containing fimbrial protein n=1 Tax=Leucobacter viscericola TaxID=2714935 RepID=A0A6G7XE59_9MICO|nr:isopeptide-forming domain-containing fimbrial protein [Leucobacter viscericola]QIK62756.1 isopeptide-forming domain-containing fimbrial protein [Leucobacter viscericola]